MKRKKCPIIFYITFFLLLLLEILILSSQSSQIEEGMKIFKQKIFLKRYKYLYKYLYYTQYDNSQSHNKFTKLSYV